MPRTAKEIAAPGIVGPTLPTSSPQTILDDAAKVEAQRQALAEFDARYGLTGPYDRDTLFRAAQTLVVETGMRMLQLGRVFELLKGHEPPGTFLEVLDSLNVSPRFAQKCMAAARKLSGSDGKRLLAGQHVSSKLLELAVLDDETLEEIAAGEVPGFTQSDIDRMSTKELRTEVSKLREVGKARDEIVQGKDQKINDLDKRLRYWGRSGTDEKADEILQDAAKAGVELASVLAKFGRAVRATRAVYDQANAPVPAEIEETITGLVKPLAERLRELTALIGE